jgi:hypothetical protein
MIDYELVLDKLRMNRSRYRERVEARAVLPTFSDSGDMFAGFATDYAPYRPSLSPLLSSHLKEEQVYWCCMTLSCVSCYVCYVA